MSLKQYQAYQNNAVNTASSEELTLMLYNGCIKFIKQAIKAMEDQNFEIKNTNIQKAQNIIQELMLTLDSNVAISQQILPLYEYIHYQLKEANVKNETALLEEVLALDRKSTRLNSSHVAISYTVFCLKKKSQ